jgi:hypothetical protein
VTPRLLSVSSLFSRIALYPIKDILWGWANSLEGFTQRSIFDPQQKYVRRISYMIYAVIFGKGTHGVRQLFFMNRPLHYCNVIRDSHCYPVFGLNVRGPAYLHGCYVVW